MHRSVYVVDDWDQGRGSPYRPWALWFPNLQRRTWKECVAKSCAAKMHDAYRFDIMVVHWSTVSRAYRSEQQAKRALRQFCETAPHLLVVAISAPPSIENAPPVLFFRRAEVGDDNDDPFGSYLAEFASHAERNALPDATLLEPEPDPAAVLELCAQLGRQLLPDKSNPIWAEAKSEVERIFRRGDGETPYTSEHLHHLIRADWPQQVFENEPTRDNVTALLRQTLVLHSAGRKLRRA